MRTQADFFRNSMDKMPLLNNNNTVNLKSFQMPSILPSNTLYNNSFLKGKTKMNNRYYLNNNNKIVPINKQKKYKSLSINKRPVKANNNFYLSNAKFYNSGTLYKSENLDNLNDLNLKAKRDNKDIFYNKFSNRTIPKKTIYKIKSHTNPLFNQNLKKIKIINNVNITNNINVSNNTYNNIQNNINNYSNLNNINLDLNFNLNFRFENENSLEKILSENYPMYPDAKHSTNSFDVITAYGVNTYRGIFRNYNEDRVSIIVNAKNPRKNSDDKNTQWPNVSFFGVFDGHAGNKCSEYLKNNLHHFIFNSNYFPENPLKAIEHGFKLCENSYIKSIYNKTRNQYNDHSGSCAIAVLIINDMCYIANLGDSRAIYSYDTGNKFYQLSKDQKPNDPKEKKRIYKAGGSIFKANLSQYGFPFSIKESELGLQIPFRILPGRLAVSLNLII